MSTRLEEVTSRIVKEVSAQQAATLELFSAQMLDMGAAPETHEMVIIGPELEQAGNKHHLVTRYYVRRRVALEGSNVIEHSTCIEACIQLEAEAKLAGAYYGGDGLVDAAMVHPQRFDGQQLVVFRGTLSPLNIITSHEQTLRDWENDFMADMSAFMPGGQAHDGLLGSALNVWNYVCDSVKPGAKLTFAGHSKGGAMAVITAALWASNPQIRGGYEADCSVVTFGAPRCLDRDAAAALAALPVDLHCYEAAGDAVPHVPLDLPSSYASLPSIFVDTDGNTRTTATQFTRLKRLALLLMARHLLPVVEAHSIAEGGLYWATVHQEAKQ